MEITLQDLRDRAALYRQKAAKATRPADIKRYREIAEALDQQVASFETPKSDPEPTSRRKSS